MTENSKKQVPVLRTRQELAGELGVSTKTIYRKLKENNIELPRSVYLQPEDQSLIYKLFGKENKYH